MANLRLDTEEGLFADRGSLPHRRPRRPREEPPLARISAPTTATRMPPPQAGTTLTEAQIATMRQWIEQGAKWERTGPSCRPCGPPCRPSTTTRGRATRSTASSSPAWNAKASSPRPKPTAPRCCAA